MSNLFPGIITVTFAAVALFFSWRLFRRKRDSVSMVLLIAAGLALRLFAAGDQYLHAWDERYHALVAKHMILHPLVPTLYEDPVLPYDYHDWTSSHVWLHKQPVPLWTMAGSMAVFGVNETALRLPSVLLTALGIWLIFVIGSYFYDRKTGYLAAFFLAFNGLILELAAGRMPTDHIDVFFLFFVELAVFFTILFIKRQKTVFNILAGVSLGMAILSKWLPALIVLPVWLLLVKDSGKFTLRRMVLQFLLLCITTVVVFLPWQIYIFRTFPEIASWEASFNMRHITEALEKNTGPFYYYLNRIRINYGELIYLPLLWLFYRLFRHPRDLKKWALAAWFFIPFIFFSAIRTKMQGYLLFTSPALFILTSAFFWNLNSWKKRIRYPVLVNILLAAFLVLPVRYAFERVKPFSTKERNPVWVKELRAMNRLLEKGYTDGGGDKIVLFNYARPVEAMFYTGMTVYENLPDTAKIREVRSTGYRVLINDRGNLADEMKQLDGVEYVHLENPPD